MANDKDIAMAELQKRGVDPFHIFSNSPLVESALTMGTGLLSTIGGGLAGIAGLPFGIDAAANTARRIQDDFTYQPRSQQAREGLGAVAKLYQPIEDAKQGFGDAALEKTGSPLMAALAYSAPEILESALGLRAAKYIPANQYDVGSVGNQSTGLGRRERGSAGGIDMPEEITVNGVKRPAFNSDGEPLGKSVQEIEEFWNWFGDSDVTDRYGRPKPVYHSTDMIFDEFDLSKSDGFWFTDDKDSAFSGDPELGATGAGEVIEAYLKIDDPDYNGANADVEDYLSSLDEDGIINMGEEYYDYAVIDNSQIRRKAKPAWSDD